MPTIILETIIHAPAEICFDLVRADRSQPETLPAIFGEFGPGQMATFKSKLFGIEQSLTVKIVEFYRPRRFVDAMIDGAFKSFVHLHEFEPRDGGTLMRDTLVWESPFGIFGKIADRGLLERHLRKVVTLRNAKLKNIAES